VAKEFLTTEEIAKKLGIHPATIRKYIRQGLLPAVRLQGMWRVRPEDYQRFLEERTKRG